MALTSSLFTAEQEIASPSRAIEPPRQCCQASGGLLSMESGMNVSITAVPVRSSGATPTSAPEVVSADLGVVEEFLAGALETVAAEIEHEASVRDGQRGLGVL